MERVLGLLVCAESCGRTGVELEAPSLRRVVLSESGRSLGKGD